MLLQIGSVYWLFLADIIKLDPDYKAEDYNLELIAYWKNYNKPRVLIKMDIIGFDYHVRNQLYVDNRSWVMGYDRQKITDKADMLTKVIDMNDYRTLDTIDRCVVMQGYNRVEKHIPLLKECGISTCVDPMDVYMAFDEYFSMEKTASERSDAKGTTNNDKIINHGFDTKVSFRGKVTTMKGKDK
ncbi:MAG: hypothetical protein IJ757_00510 [Clostridiales bacterium]|nr:hypothetical protein [Clostridiales bacterium]